MSKKKLLVLLISLLFPCPLFAEVNNQDYNQENLSEKNPEITSETDEWSLTTSINYETGDFGTDTTTNTIYVPLTLTRDLTEAEVSLTVPYISQKSGPGVTAFSGIPLRTSQATSGKKRQESGLGDIILGGKYFLIKEDTNPISLFPVGRIKFPTASEDDGLGSGEFDETIGLESKKSLNKEWTLYGDIYYTFIGEPEGLDLENEFAYNLGVGCDITQATVVSIYYQERTALINGEDNPRQLAFYATHDLQTGTSLFGGIGVGLTNSSPDTSLSLGISFGF